MSQPVLTIGPEHLHKDSLKVGGRSYGNPLGVTQPQDYGKQVYLVGGTLQVENNEQRAARLAKSIHKATPGGPKEERTGVGHCGVCGQRVKRIRGGQGPIWVHSDTGAVAAPNPPEAADEPDALGRLMADYDNQFPGATEFERGSFEFEAKKVLGRLARLGGTISFNEVQP